MTCSFLSAREALGNRRLAFIAPIHTHAFLAWGSIHQGQIRSVDDDSTALATLASATAAAFPTRSFNADLSRQESTHVPSSESDESSELVQFGNLSKNPRRACGCASRGTHRTSCYLKGFVSERPSSSEFRPRRECGCAWKGRHLSVCSLSSATTLASTTLASMSAAGRGQTPRNFGFSNLAQDHPRESSDFMMAQVPDQPHLLHQGSF